MSDTTVVTIAAYLVMLPVSYGVCHLLHVTGLLAHLAHWLEGGK